MERKYLLQQMVDSRSRTFSARWKVFTEVCAQWYPYITATEEAQSSSVSIAKSWHESRLVSRIGTFHRWGTDISKPSEMQSTLV